MKETYSKLMVAVLAVGILSSCKPKYTEPELSAGELNFKRFVMIGDGHAAGFMDDALYFDGQQNGIANLLSKQFELVGGAALTTKFVNENSVGANANGQSRLILDFKEDCNGVSSLSPVRKSIPGDLSVITVFSYSGEALFRNLTIPGLKLTQVSTANLAQFNPFFSRIASSDNNSVLTDALSHEPTFFGLYLGIEDVMTYARSGGTNNQLPTIDEFTSSYTQIVSQMKANGSHGFIATIPDVTLMPYFRTIPYNGLNLDEENATQLNNIFGPLGMNFQVGPNGFNIVDPEANEFQVRQIQDGELLLLSIPLDSVKCHKMGSIFPFRDEFVLTSEEQETLKEKINGYNQVIRNLANDFNLALVETNTAYHKLFSGFTYNGVSLSAQFVTGGAFSLDGIHLNPRGNAILTNEFIKAINQKFNTTIPLLNPLNYKGVLFP